LSAGDKTHEIWGSFGIANGIFAILLGARWNPLVSTALVGIAVVVPSLGWYAWSQMPPDEDRDRLKGYRMQFASYFIQFTATFFTLIAATAVLEKTFLLWK
jgi:hypothetical protein